MKIEELQDRYRDLGAKIEGIFHAAVDGLIIIDEAGRIEMFNPSAEKIFGYDAAEVTGKNISVLMPEPYRSEHDSYLSAYAHTRKARIIGIGREVVGRRKDGSVFPMEISVGEVVSPERPQFVGIVRDISGRRAIEDALKRSEEELRLIFRNAPIGMFTTDRRGRMTGINPTLLKMLGCSEAQLLGRSCFLLAADDDDRLRTAFYQMAQGELETAHFETRWLTMTRATLHVSIHLGIVRTPGRRDFVIGQVFDRTEQLASERTLREASDQLTHVGRLTTLGEMASAIAHEINQPLTAISAHAQACRRILDSGASDDELVRDAFKQISEQALRAGEVVKMIRAFVRKRESEKELADIEAVLVTVLKLAEIDTRAAGVKVTANIEDDLPQVLIDSVQIQQVCLNLIRNAIDAIQEIPDGEHRITIACGFGNKRIKVSVDDTGTGVPEEFRDQLFNPFFTTKDAGMGMGLSISHSIIAAHGGQLVYETNDSGGSRFSFGLPIPP
jgi:two-component system sensor kinase FixL